MAWAALLLAWPCLGGAAVVVDASRTDEIHSEVDQLKDAVANRGLSDAKVYGLAADLFGRMPSTRIVVQPNIRGWDREPVPAGKPASVKQLLETADKRMTFYNKEVPQPMVKAMDYAKSMTRDGRIEYDQAGQLQDHQMGEYDYWADKLELGRIKLNNLLALLAAKVGDVFAFATVAHEAGHARDHLDGKLNPKAVIDGEVLAFQTQYYWLKIADPYGERICYLRAGLMNEQRERPNRLSAIALTYLNHLAELQGTGGDKDQIRRMVEKLGYRDGETHRQGDSTSA